MANQAPQSEAKVSSTPATKPTGESTTKASTGKELLAAKLRRLSERLVSFRVSIAGTLIISILLVGGFVLTTAHQTVRESKFRDVWAILFLELEHQAQIISEKLHAESNKPGEGELATYSVKADGGLIYLSGPNLKLKSLQDLGIEEFTDLAGWNLISVNEQDHVLRRYNLHGKRTVTISPHTVTLALDNKARVSETSKIYVATRQGRLIYSNAKDINAKTFLERPLVQKFITLSPWQGQVQFKTADGHFTYGYFNEIPGTNLTVFAETAMEVVTEPVNAMTRKLLIRILLVLGVTLIILQLPLHLLLRPVDDLVTATRRVAAGDFNAEPEREGLGEIKVLSMSFRNMTAALREREATIQRLLVDQKEKTRLEGEMVIAKGIQDNLLPTESLPDAAGVEVISRYIPAGEVAGDWYGHFYSAERDAAVIAILDISGHGAGASMFTAIAAAVFEDFSLNFATDQDPNTFFSRLNHQLQRYGRNKWSATAQIGIFWHATKTFSIYNAGHPSPMVVGADGTLSTPAHMASNPLGLTPEIVISEVKVPLTKDGMVIFYTDGLIERRDGAGRYFGKRKFRTALTKLSGRSPRSVVDGLVAAADTHAGGLPAQDDLCLIAARCA